MRYAVEVANIGTYSDPRTVLGLAAAAEEAGWDGLFLWDHLAFAWGPPAADPWVTLAAVAATTERLRLGPMVTPVARRRPHVLAHQVATLDVLSGGRVIFGAGLGGSASEFEKFGDPGDPKLRAERLDEGLDVMRRLWSGDEVHHRGRHYVVAGVALRPTPAQPSVPVWIGGNRQASLRRAARWDGWIADSADPTGMTLTPADVAERIARIEAAREVPGPSDVAVLGECGKADPAAYAAAGATWWVENVHDLRGDAEAMLALVAAGPPR